MKKISRRDFLRGTTAAGATMMLSMALGGAMASAESSETVTIKYGTHYINDLDPYYVNETTGEYTMGESARQAAIAGLAAIKEAYNVEFEFLQYPNDVQEDLLTSVLAGDPVCDIALLWGGVEPTILSQNVLQDLSSYSYLFEDDESSWMLYEEMFGGYYLLNNETPNMTYFPLIVNLTMLEAVDSLKDDSGNTIYPMDLFDEGNWTWSTFQDYLEKVQAYYANTEAADGAQYDYVQAYETDHRYAALAAIHANGGAIYNNGVTADSDEAIEGVQFIEQLMTAGLLTDCGLYDDGYTPQWTVSATDFGSGSTVFTDCPNWSIYGAASSCAERGESIGIIPWPRPDDMEADDPNYMQSTNMGNSCAILKGVSEEKTELAIKAYILYWQTYYTTIGGVETMAEYNDATAVSNLAGYGVDVYNEVYGDQLIESYTYILDHMNINYAHKLNLWDGCWETILGQSLYGLNGMSSYDVAIKANISMLTNQMESVEQALASDEIHDNRPPKITTEDVILEAGTDVDSVDWTAYFSAEDSVDGTIEVTSDMITFSDELDLSVAGVYSSAVTATVADSSGNETSSSITVTVYDSTNTEPPVIEELAEEDIPTTALDTDTSSIDWSNYISSAVDADGIDVSDSITADLSMLDTTTPGTYDVTLTVTDYAGNQASVTVTVTVVSE
ncbi:MAG: twin-arginine translocation signal domain-containing protein [Clostridiales bacterium]|nr:twin-arginine translocation signal domain-containing protein [Clostridiales bacterium]